MYSNLDIIAGAWDSLFQPGSSDSDTEASSSGTSPSPFGLPSPDDPKNPDWLLWLDDD